MKAQEIEAWTRSIVTAVLSNQPVEDFRVELKSIWIEPGKAAHRLAAHANASRGEPILWIMGVDEKNKVLTNIDPLELATWYSSLQKHFDGFAPRLLVDVNIRFDTSTVTALYFDTEREAPYVVKGAGGYPQFIIPWREGTGLRAAKREDLLLILVPIRRLSALLGELEFNIAIANYASKGSYDDWGTPFREEEFYRALRDGAISALPGKVKQLITEAYVVVGRANKRVSGALSITLSAGDTHNAARKAVIDSLPQLRAAHNALLQLLR